MNTSTSNKHRAAESGNVLFLILIAVALFAALSYAVTQSTRSGGGDANKETSLINSAQLSQYPSAIRTAIVRMIINGVAVDELLFNPPSDYAAIVGDETKSVFHSEGGGAVYANAPIDLLSSGGTGEWAYNMNVQIEYIGTTNAANNSGNDLVAFLPNVSKSVCKKINDELGIAATADANSDGIPTGPNYTPDPADQGDYMDDGYTIPGTPDVTLDDDFSGQPFGCYDVNNTGVYVYYHVLVER